MFWIDNPVNMKYCFLDTQCRYQDIDCTYVIMTPCCSLCDNTAIHEQAAYHVVLSQY